MSAPETPIRPRLVERPPEVPARFGEAPFKIRNVLSEHPLFEPDRIRRLLRTLPRAHVEIRRVEVSDTHAGTFQRGPMQKDADPVVAFDGLRSVPVQFLRDSGDSALQMR